MENFNGQISNTETKREEINIETLTELYNSLLEEDKVILEEAFNLTGAPEGEDFVTSLEYAKPEDFEEIKRSLDDLRYTVNLTSEERKEIAKKIAKFCK